VSLSLSYLSRAFNISKRGHLLRRLRFSVASVCEEHYSLCLQTQARPDVLHLSCFIRNRSTVTYKQTDRHTTRKIERFYLYNGQGVRTAFWGIQLQRCKKPQGFAKKSYYLSKSQFIVFIITDISLY